MKQTIKLTQKNAAEPQGSGAILQSPPFSPINTANFTHDELDRIVAVDTFKLQHNDNRTLRDPDHSKPHKRFGFCMSCGRELTITHTTHHYRQQLHFCDWDCMIRYQHIVYGDGQACPRCDYKLSIPVGRTRKTRF